jgi:hypothetical protein
MMRSIALAAGLIMIIGAAVIIGARLLPHGGRVGSGPDSVSSRTSVGTVASAVPDVFGIPTVSKGCPAASVRVTTARCPASPECWAGMVVISGAASARSVPCGQPHYWQTFAIAFLPADARTFDQPTLEANPEVRAVCSMPVMLRSRRGRGRRLPASAWRVDVLPPTEAAFNSGTRTYRCIANVISGEQSTSQFGG